MLKRDERPVVYLRNGQLFASFLPMWLFINVLGCLGTNRQLVIEQVVILKTAFIGFTALFLIRRKIDQHWLIPRGARIGVTFLQGCGVVLLVMLTSVLQWGWGGSWVTPSKSKDAHLT